MSIISLSSYKWTLATLIMAWTSRGTPGTRSPTQKTSCPDCVSPVGNSHLRWLTPCDPWHITHHSKFSSEGPGTQRCALKSASTSQCHCEICQPTRWSLVTIGSAGCLTGACHHPNYQVGRGAPAFLSDYCLSQHFILSSMSHDMIA